MAFSLRLPCDQVTTVVLREKRQQVFIQGLCDVEDIIHQLQGSTTECEILDCFDEEQLTNYMQEKFNVTIESAKKEKVLVATYRGAIYGGAEVEAKHPRADVILNDNGVFECWEDK